MWTVLASLPAGATPAAGLPGDLPYALLIGLLGAGLQMTLGELWRLVTSESFSPIESMVLPAQTPGRNQWDG